MLDSISVSNMLNSIIPISRFNKGEASKIFREVNDSGTKIVVKNNKPTCILVTPKKYEEMMETIEDYHLFLEAEKRIENSEESDLIGHKEIMKEPNINESELKDVEIEIE
ncbi:MAG: type II toxin-antitoxin system prevent-host-death family antitoxin [Alkaliphilus sp.]